MSVAGEAIQGRVLIDASMVRGGGGYTHLMNLLPEISRIAPDLDFKVSKSRAIMKNPEILKPEPEPDFKISKSKEMRKIKI